MKFCSKCDNKLYMSISEKDGNRLVYNCRFCQNVDEDIDDDGACVLNSQLKKGEQRFNHIINRYTKMDPTLPRIYNMRCPNGDCRTNIEREERPEVIYMRYDDDNMKYLYLCVECDSIWKTDDRK